MSDIATRLRAWWWRRQGLDGSLHDQAPADVLTRAGWARSVGGVGPYLALFARAGTRRAVADAAVADLEIHELPAARGCTYVLPAADFALGLAVGHAFGGAEMKVAAKLGVTAAEIDALGEAVLAALADGDPRDPDAIRAAVGDRARSLGAEGKKKGVTTTLPVALGQLQARGAIRRVPVNGRLDQQRYAYARWAGGPTQAAGAGDEAFVELARRFFGWIGPATAKEFQWFSGLGAKAAAVAMAPLELVPVEDLPDRLLLPADADAYHDVPLPDEPAYALVGSLDPIAATRRDITTLIADEDAERARVLLSRIDARSGGGLSDLPSHAILDRGRLIGLWEYDPEAAAIVWATFDGARPAALQAAVAITETFVRDDLGDARSFSLDSPKSRGPRLAALRGGRE